MKETLNFIRGLARPFLTFVMPGAFIAFIFLKVDPPAEFKTMVAMIVAFYFAERARNHTPTPGGPGG